MSRRLVILTEGRTDPQSAKTAAAVLRYGRERVVALIDSTRVGSTSQELLGAGGAVPVVARLADCPECDALLIGIAPPGGRLPEAWRPVVREALERGLTVLSGLHDLLADDPEFAETARRHGAELVDLRRCDEREVARQEGLDPGCLRIHTVGHDCSVGKMVAALEVARGLEERGHDARFVATGQTGILIEGDGCPIDAVVADFVSGAAEGLVRSKQHHEILVVEGQGSLFHPSYSGVTLGLLHGCLPHGLILCYEPGRDRVRGLEHVPLPGLDRVCEVYETMGGLFQPAPVIGVAMNGTGLDDAELEAERQKTEKDLGRPVCDVVRDGPDRLVDAVLRLQVERAP